MTMNNPDESLSRSIGGVLGPAVMAIVAAEFPLWQPDLYAQQTVYGVYFSGTLFFIAGLALVRAHNLWRWSWVTLITLIGWAVMALGFIRMFFAGGFRQATTDTGSPLFMAIEIILFVIGLIITVKSWKAAKR